MTVASGSRPAGRVCRALLCSLVIGVAGAVFAFVQDQIGTLPYAADVRMTLRVLSVFAISGVALAACLRLLYGPGHGRGAFQFGCIFIFAIQVARFYASPVFVRENLGAETVADLFGDRLLKAGYEGERYELMLRAPHVQGLLEQAAKDAIALGRWAKLRAERASNRGVILSFAPPLSDAYGNEVVDDALVLSWLQKDWEKINWEGIGEEQILALSHVNLEIPAVWPAFTEWCSQSQRMRWQGCQR